MITLTKPEHFTGPLQAAGAVIMVDDKILLIKRSSDKAFGANQWAVIGGKLDVGENFEIGMKREVFEEVGIDIQLGSVIKHVMFYHVPEVDSSYHLEYCLYLVEMDNRPEVIINSENSAYGWFSFDEMLTLDLIEDAKYCIEYLLSS